MRTGLLVSAGVVLSMAAYFAGCGAAMAGPGRGPAANNAAAAATQTVDATVAERMLTEPTRRVLKLTNGFTIILQQNKTAPVVAARIYVRAGALTEQQHMGAGISHVLEHLVAGASSGKRKEEENTLLLQQIGNDSNAYTDEDHTCYFITTTSDKWQVAMDLLVDFTTNTDFTKEQFDREYKVVQRELEMDEAEADRTFYLRTQSTRYLESPAKHPVIGYKPAFQALTFEDAKAYYQKMYVPDNMIISVAGDIDPAEVEKVVIEQVKGIRRKAVPSIALATEPVVPLPRRSVSHADVRQARVEWAFPTINMYSPDLYATDVLASVLGGGESSILVRRLRDELGLVVAVNCNDATPSYTEGELAIDVVMSPEKIPAAQKALLAALEEVVKNGVPADVIDRAKATAAASMVFGNQTAEQQAIRNAMDFMATGNIDYTKTYIERLEAVTPAEVLAMARKYINTDRMLTTALLPLNAADPFVDADAAGTQVAAAQTVTKKITLKNGLTVLITRNTGAPLASFNLYTLGGILAENDANNGTGSAMMEMLTHGTSTRTHDQIEDYLDATGTTLSAESGNNSFALSEQCLKEHAADAFALFADVALHPKFAADELEQLKPQLLAGIEQSTEDWFEEAYKATKEAYYAQGPYKRLPIGRAEVVSKLTPADLQKHYNTYFLNPQKTVISIAGDIDPAVAEQWVQVFGAIPQSSPALDLSTKPAAPGTIMRHTDKQSATVMFAFPPGIKVDDPDRFALTLLQTYLGGYSSPGGSVLHETLRGKGLVYTVQASVVSGPAGGMFLIAALGEPPNAQEIVTNVQAIIAAAKAGDISDVQIAAAKDQTITGEKLSKQTIADKSSAEALDELLGMGYDDSTKFPERIRAVTKADLVRVANKYLTAPVIVITTPDAKEITLGNWPDTPTTGTFSAGFRRHFLPIIDEAVSYGPRTIRPFHPLVFIPGDRWLTPISASGLFTTGSPDSAAGSGCFWNWCGCIPIRGSPRWCMCRGVRILNWTSASPVPVSCKKCPSPASTGAITCRCFRGLRVR